MTARVQVRVALSYHLRALAGVDGDVVVEVEAPASIGAVLDALEERHPTLRGTVREHDRGPRRAFMRYFAGREDVSHQPPDAPLPDGVTRGDEVFRILGAIAGG